MIVSELVFSVLDISLWIKFPETVVEFASPKNIGHSSVPKKTPGIVVFGSQPMDPPTRSWKSSHGQGSFWGEIQVAVFSGLGAQNAAQKTGGPLTMYIHPKTDWLENPAWMKFVCPVEDGGFSNVMFFLLGCMVYLALRFNSWPLENDGTRSYFPGGTPYIECLWYQDYLVRAIGDTGL